MKPEGAFAIYLDYAPEMEFMKRGDSEDTAFTESMQAIVQEAKDRQILLHEAQKVYRLAARCFFDQVVNPFQEILKNLAGERYNVKSKKRIIIIEGVHLWQFRSKDDKLLFEVGFLFSSTQGKCIATPWFWSSGKALNLNRDQLAEKLGKFSFPRTGNWYPGALIANSVEYCTTSDIKKLNSDLISPIEFAVKAIVKQIER
ncbi:MAG: hypothetical protein M0003_10915 [Acidithiobacillus sp.]|nr:hypothetical protein [Acidithiobacillus sp.]